MPLKVYDTKDAVPADKQAAAVETKDGKWLVEEADPALGEAGERALKSEREARKREEDARKAAEKERDDLKRDADARRSGVTEEELKKIRESEAAARKPIEDELAKEKEKRETVERENRKLKLTDRVQALALKHGIMNDRIEDAMMILDTRAELGDEGGIIFKDKSGAKTADSPETFFPKFKIEKPWLFAGSGAAGGGDEEPPPTSAPRPAAALHPSIGGRF